MATFNLFEELGLDPNTATYKEYITAYRRYAIENHPDTLRARTDLTEEEKRRRMGRFSELNNFTEPLRNIPRGPDREQAFEEIRQRFAKPGEGQNYAAGYTTPPPSKPKTENDIINEVLWTFCEDNVFPNLRSIATQLKNFGLSSGQVKRVMQGIKIRPGELNGSFYDEANFTFPTGGLSEDQAEIVAERLAGMKPRFKFDYNQLYNVLTTLWGIHSERAKNLLQNLDFKPVYDEHDEIIGASFKEVKEEQAEGKTETNPFTQNAGTRNRTRENPGQNTPKNNSTQEPSGEPKIEIAKCDLAFIKGLNTLKQKIRDGEAFLGDKVMVRYNLNETVVKYSIWLERDGFGKESVRFNRTVLDLAKSEFVDNGGFVNYKDGRKIDGRMVLLPSEEICGKAGRGSVVMFPTTFAEGYYTALVETANAIEKGESFDRESKVRLSTYVNSCKTGINRLGRNFPDDYFIETDREGIESAIRELIIEGNIDMQFVEGMHEGKTNFR